jgi:predicted nucleic acid-binding protein
VLDTSCLIGSHRHALIFTAERSYYTALTSTFIVGEYARVRAKLSDKRGVPEAIYREHINRAILILTRLAIVVDYTRLEGGDYTRWLTDPDDEPFLATALVGRAQYIVSANTRDFPPDGLSAGVHYLTRRISSLICIACTRANTVEISRTCQLTGFQEQPAGTPPPAARGGRSRRAGTRRPRGRCCNAYGRSSRNCTCSRYYGRARSF